MTISSEVRDVPADQLTVDPRVQRLVDPGRVRRLADNWDDKMTGILTVSDRRRLVMPGAPGDVDVAGELVVLDGQTRVAAFRVVCGEGTSAPLLCQVYTGLTLQEEAAMFLDHNDRKAVHVRDRFRLSVTAGEEWALNVVEMTAHFGWAARGLEADPGFTGHKLRKYACLGAVERVYKADDGVALRRTLEVIGNAWNGQADTVTTETVSGIGGLFVRHPGLESKQVQGLVVKLRKVAPGQFIGDITADKRRNGSSTAQTAYLYTKGIYNRGRLPENQI